jgi:hypothetical protein
MTRDQSRRILDTLRDGDADYSIAIITEALTASGDIPTGDPERGEATDTIPLWVSERVVAIGRVAPASPTP